MFDIKIKYEPSTIDEGINLYYYYYLHRKAYHLWHVHYLLRVLTFALY